MNKQDLMEELLDRYQQLDSVEGCPSAKKVLEMYVKNWK